MGNRYIIPESVGVGDSRGGITGTTTQVYMHRISRRKGARASALIDRKRGSGVIEYKGRAGPYLSLGDGDKVRLGADGHLVGVLRRRHRVNRPAGGIITQSGQPKSRRHTAGPTSRHANCKLCSMLGAPDRNNYGIRLHGADRA
jgi:hypothetical protein